ncbi:hypothetical protein C4D60_Mb03t02360 [Musa balbisiana]|uniref:Protein-L-isoaspartate O-methyltransferase n=1 Tax=Musa balbisiana TaxID=52838 RepID=A0A4S8J812_MUSBA|nr:hypothetical protein C4D60_Mb03t02360 [Musa balbisiana]
MCALIGPPFQVWRSGSHWQPSELQVGDRPKPPRGPRGRCATWPLVDEAAREGGTYPWLHQPERPRYPGRLGYIPQHQGDARSASLRLLRSGFCCRRLLASPSALLLPFPTPLSFFLFPWFPPFQSLVRNGGTGYLTACFAMMVGPQGRTVGVEHIPQLVASSINSIKRSAASSLLNDGSLSVHTADGRKGWPELAPYDAIHVGAASPDIPRALLEQLKPGGRMVIPVGNFFQDLKVVDKNDDGSVGVYSEASVRFVPLTSRAAQLQDY